MSNHYSQYYPQQPHREDPRVLKLKQDNLELQKALKQLNQCYQEKTTILESELQKGKKREQALLAWKSSYIDKELFQNSKYEQQLERVIKIMQEMAGNYQKQTQTFKLQLEQKQEEISHFKDQNVYLRQERDNQDEKIQNLAKKYIYEIERLNNQLKDLKDQVNYDDIPQSNNFSVEDDNQEEENAQNFDQNGDILVHSSNFCIENPHSRHDQKEQVEQQNVLKDISNKDSKRNTTLHVSNEKVSHQQGSSSTNVI